MKEFILILLISGTVSSQIQHCCPGDVLMEMYDEPKCGNETIKFNCADAGYKRYYLFRDIVVDGNKIAEQPVVDDYITDDVSRYCVAEMYDDQSMALWTVPVALICFGKDDRDTQATSSIDITTTTSKTTTTTTRPANTSPANTSPAYTSPANTSPATSSLDITRQATTSLANTSQATTYLVETSFQFRPMDFIPLISVLFLVATLCVYIALSQLRKLQDLCYMALCVTMSIAFLNNVTLSSLIEGAIINSNTPLMCTSAGISNYFWLLATFFYVNIVCINLYLCMIRDMERSKWKYFLCYNCYVWGGTVAFVGGAVLADNVEGHHWKPRFGEESCFINGDIEMLIFFRGPLALLFTSNIVLFILTACKIWRGTGLEDNKLKSYKQKFLQALRIFLVMGISWIAQVFVYTDTDERPVYWTIIQCFNALQGVVMFIVLVLFRRSVVKGLLKKGCCVVVTRPLLSRKLGYDDMEEDSLTEDHNIFLYDGEEVREAGHA